MKSIGHRLRGWEKTKSFFIFVFFMLNLSVNTVNVMTTFYFRF